MTAIQHHGARIGRGPGYVANIGLIALETDLVVEPDVDHFCALDGVAVFTNRIPMPDRTDRAALLSMLPHIGRVAKGFAPLGRIDAVIYGCTAASVAIGPQRVRDEINKALPDVPVTNPIAAVLEALRALQCRSVDLLVPYAEDVTRDVIDFLAVSGIDVENCITFGTRSGLDIGMIEPDSIREAADRLRGGTADALFISCTALRVAPVFSCISQTQGRPVVSSNQALAWHALRLAGIDAPIRNVGDWLRRRGMPEPQEAPV